MQCFFCGLLIIPEFDEHEQKHVDPWEDKDGNRYCDQCYYNLYTVVEEKALESYNHDNKRIRERARAKLKKLEEVWGKY